MLVPLPKFLPDQSNFNPGASGFVSNAQPTQEGWGPIKSLTPISEALASAPRGSIGVKTDAGSFLTYTGTATDLYVLDSAAYTWTSKSKSAAAYSLPDGAFWRFARWANTIVATAENAGGVYPQALTLDGAGDFADLTNATFTAELVATVGDFLVFARIGGDDRKIKWSAVNDDTFWTAGQRGADDQVLPDGGRIQAILEQSQDAIIVQENMIRSMQFSPDSGYTFRFVTLDPSRGAFAPRSVVSIAPNDFVFLAKDGYYRWFGGQMTAIGAERVDHWFFENCAPDKYDLVSAVADPFSKVVHFRFEDAAGTNYILSYDWDLNAWFYQTNNAQDMITAATAGETLSTLTTLYGTIGAMPYELGSRFYSGGIPGLAGFDSSNRLGFFDGPNLEAIIETEDKALNYPRRSITNNIIVLADTGDAQVAIATKEDQADAVSFGAYLTRSTNLPYISSRTSGRWQRFRVKIPAASTWTNMVALDVSSTDGGYR